MSQPECDGEERHTHYVLDTGTIMSHIHEHSITTKEFNRLHHHPPVEHAKFTTEELIANAEFLDVPF